MHVAVKSTSNALQLTLAYAAVAAGLRAYQEWCDLQTARSSHAYKLQLAAAGAATLHTRVENALGTSAALQLDFGDRT